MKKYSILFLLVIFFIILNTQTLNLRVFSDVSNLYITSTTHFNFVYRKELSENIGQIAKISEGLYDTLKAIMKTSPPNKINILITDQSDLPNGFATPILNPTVNIYLSHPDPSFISKYTNWIEYVLSHELTHIFHLTKTKPSFLSKRRNSCLYAPSVMQPMYFLEGYAVYNESTLKNGRLKDTNFESILRTFYLDKKIPPLDRAISYYDSEYPYGLLPYIYGSYIFDKTIKLKNKTIEKVTDIDPFTCLPLHILFPDYFFFLKNSYLPSQILDSVYKDVEVKTNLILKKYVFSLREEIFNDNLEKENPTIFDSSLIYIESYPHKKNRVIMYSKNKKKELFKTSITSKLNVNSSYIIFDMIDIYDNISYFYSIYSYDFKTKKIEKLPHTTRGFSPELFGDTIFFIREQPFSNSLIIYSFKEKRVIDSILFPQNYRINSLSTKDGETFLFSIHRDGGFTDIMSFNLKTRENLFLTQDMEADFFPKWSKTKNGFYFVSDREGFNTIFYFDIQTHSIKPCLRSIYKISNYDVDEENGFIYFQDISSNGENIYKGKMIENDEFYTLELKEYKEYVPIKKDILFNRSHKYLIPLFSGPGIYYTLPIVLPLFKDSTEISDIFFLLPFLNVNSDISQSISFANIGIFSYTYGLTREFSDIQYYDYSQFSISAFKNDIFVELEMLNSGNKREIYRYLPDRFYLSTGTIFENLKFNSIFGLKPIFSILKTDTNFTKGTSIDLYFSNAESSIRSIIPSRGNRFSLNIYHSTIFDINDSVSYDMGINFRLEKYFSVNWRFTTFTLLETYFTKQNSIRIEGLSFLEKRFYEKVKSKYIFTEDGNFVDFQSNNFNILKFGFLYVPVNINRGIPKNIFISSPMKLAYLTLSGSHSEGYSLQTHNRVSFSKLSMNILVNIFSLGFISPGIYFSRDHIERRNSFGFSLQLF